jgi:mannosyltransferase OCH1-like enzyme
MIPRIVYQTWYSKQCIPPAYREIMSSNQAMNPEYRFVLMDDNDMDALFEDRTQISDTTRMAYQRINPRYGPARADLFRYVILFLKGGIYLDIKARCLVPFRQWICSDDDSGILSYWDGIHYNMDVLKNKEGELQNWNLVFSRGHLVLKEVIRECCRKILETTIVEASSEAMTGKRAVLETTGPLLLTRCAEAFVLPITASPLSRKKDTMVRRVVSSRYLDYGNSFNGLLMYHPSSYTHYTLLKEPLLLHSRNVIPLKDQSLPVCSISKPGIYWLYPVLRVLRPIGPLLRGCHVVFAVHHGMLSFLALAPTVPLECVRRLWTSSSSKNMEQVLYEGPWCIKQAVVTSDDHLCFHHQKYIQFDA